MALATPAFAQSIGGFTVPQDVRSQPGGGYSPVTPTYKTDGSANNWINPTVTAPSQTGLTNIPLASTTGRVSTSDSNGTGPGQPFCLTTLTGGTCTQAKFRTTIGSRHVKVLADDPQRNYCQFGASHAHLFFGNIQINACSTYKSLRTAAQSDAAGYDANGTGYWIPITYKTNPFADGKNYAVRPMYEIVYYLEDQPANGPTTSNIPPGLRYVLLYNMDDQWQWLQTLVDNANTASGSHRYSLVANSTQFTGSISGTTLTVTSVAAGTIASGWRLDGVGLANDTEIVSFGTGTGGVGTYTINKSQTVSSEAMIQGSMGGDSFYTCVHNGTSYTAKEYKRVDGTDPFAGNCDYAGFTGSLSGTTLTVTAVSHGTLAVGQRVAIAGATTVQGIINSLGTGTGGTGTYILDTSGTVSSQSMESFDDFYVNVSGPSCWDGTNLWSPGGYKHVIPSIFDSSVSKFVCPPNFWHLPTVQMEIHLTQRGFGDYGNWRLSSDDARATACGCTIASGITFHTDWMDGWDDNVRRLWEDNCIGTVGKTPHECNSSVVSSTQHLIGGYVGENGPLFSPQVDFNKVYPTTSAANMLMVPSTKMGPKTMNMHQ